MKLLTNWRQQTAIMRSSRPTWALRQLIWAQRSGTKNVRLYNRLLSVTINEHSLFVYCDCRCVEAGERHGIAAHYAGLRLQTTTLPGEKVNKTHFGRSLTLYVFRFMQNSREKGGHSNLT